MNGDSYRLKQSVTRRQSAITVAEDKQNPAATKTGDQSEAPPTNPQTR
jgi:hypothetical protein